MEEKAFTTKIFGVSIEAVPRIIRVTTDDALRTFLAEPGNGSLALSQRILQWYDESMGCPLQITETSMATEILLHVMCDQIFLKAEHFSSALPGGLGKKLVQVAKSMEGHTAVIDIGEKSEDTNRSVFDALSGCYGVICRILGDKA